MRIETLRIKNFKVFKDVEIKDIPNMAVFLGMNGVGKTTFFDIFGFLNDCLSKNVKSALASRGGYNEVISREQTGDIEFMIKFRQNINDPLITYELSIGIDDKKQPVINKEIMRFRRGQYGAPFKVLDFVHGVGKAAVGEFKTREDIINAQRREQKLESPDILAIKGLGQFKDFETISALRKLIEDWYVSDFHIEDARQRNDAGYSENLSRTGDNLPNVAKYIFDNHKNLFNDILKKMKERVPGVDNIEASVTQDGYIVLRFGDGKFKNPFSARFVSDGTIKMFAYLIMLNAPNPHSLLCVEEPENQLYPKLLPVLADEFRAYSRAGQVFISTHSPDFLNAVELSELYCLVKKEGFTKIYRATDSPLISSLYAQGDLLGHLWSQELLLEEVSK